MIAGKVVHAYNVRFNSEYVARPSDSILSITDFCLGLHHIKERLQHNTAIYVDLFSVGHVHHVVPSHESRHAGHSLTNPKRIDCAPSNNTTAQHHCSNMSPKERWTCLAHRILGLGDTTLLFQKTTWRLSSILFLYQYAMAACSSYEPLLNLFLSQLLRFPSPLLLSCLTDGLCWSVCCFGGAGPLDRGVPPRGMTLRRG